MPWQQVGQESTWQLPWLALVEVDVDHGDAAVRAAATARELAAEVVEHELVVPRVEPEPRGQPRLHHADQAHGYLPSLQLLLHTQHTSPDDAWERTGKMSDESQSLQQFQSFRAPRWGRV